MGNTATASTVYTIRHVVLAKTKVRVKKIGRVSMLKVFERVLGVGLGE